MGKKKKARREPHAMPPATRKWGVRNVAILVVVLAIGGLIGVGSWKATHRQPQPVVAAPDDEPANDRDQNREAAPRDARSTSPGFSKLKGKWIRTDGGYIVDIKRVDEHGKMDAAYLNPNPIHVAKAEASQEGTATKVFIELRDVNYPGSTYDLVYDPQRDQLTGVYFQAVQQQHFDVTFDRQE
jgi:hypothetical protein